jgi:1,4-dihydroxy-2-naphthoate octaprenyltransferase
MVVVIGLAYTAWALLAVGAGALALGPVRQVRSGARGRDLITVLGQTGRLQLVFGALLTLGLWLGR